MKLLLWCVSWVIVLRGNNGEYGWTYDGENGVQNWLITYPECGGRSQSPIDIVRDKAVYELLPEFSFTGYEELPVGAAYTLENTGLSAKVKFSSNETDAFTVSDGGLPTLFVSDQLHFHWGGTSKEGSEHTVDGESYPLEMHIVSHSSFYADLSEAVDKQEGLALLGVFFKIGNHSEALDRIIKHLKNVTYATETVAISPFPLRSLLPSNLTSFWRYTGSLTTPPCLETVTWTVFQEPLSVSEEQLVSFRALLSDSPGSNETNYLLHTYRPPQPLEGRTVFSSVPVPTVKAPSTAETTSTSTTTTVKQTTTTVQQFDPFEEDSAASSVKVSVVLLVVLLILF